MNTGIHPRVAGVSYSESGVGYRASAPGGLTRVADKNLAAVRDGNEGLFLNREDALWAMRKDSGSSWLFWGE